MYNWASFCSKWAGAYVHIFQLGRACACVHIKQYAVNKEIRACVFLFGCMLWARWFSTGWGLCSHSAIYAVNKEIPSWVGLVFLFSYIMLWVRRFPTGWGLCSCSAIYYYVVNKDIHNWVGLVCLYPIWPPHNYRCCLPCFCITCITKAGIFLLSSSSTLLHTNTHTLPPLLIHSCRIWKALDKLTLKKS